MLLIGFCNALPMRHPKDFSAVTLLLSVADHTWIKIEKLGISDHPHETAELPEKLGYLKKTHGNFGLTEFIIY